MKKNLSSILLILILSANPLGAVETVTERSGMYRELILAVDPATGTATGYYENSTGWDSEAQRPRFNCIFFLRGKKRGDKYAIQTWFPADTDPKQVISGELRFLPGEGAGSPPSVWVRLNQEHGGCWNVNPVISQPAGDRLFLEKPGDWVEVRVVKSGKAFFHEAPTAGKAKRAYVVRGDALAVLEKKPGWVLGDYQGKAKGWVREEDLFSTTPP